MDEPGHDQHTDISTPKPNMDPSDIMETSPPRSILRRSPHTPKSLSGVKVAFSSSQDTVLIESRRRRSRINMSTKMFQTVRKADGDDEVWEEAAKLFSENYGVWGPDSGRGGMPISKFLSIPIRLT